MSDLCKIEVVPVVLEKHPNADTLSVVKVFDGYTVVVRTADWQGKNKGAYIPPDNVVPGDRPEFAFLDGKFRIKSKRLRGVMSQGLLVPVPDNFQVGDDVTEYFGVTRYVPPADVEIDGDIGSEPPIPGIKYDIESWFKYKNVLVPDENVVITEKIHGTNSRFTFQDGKIWAASRTFYRNSPNSVYFRVLSENPQIEEFCRAFPNVILYGEIFGWVQDLKYGAKKGQIWFRAFDVYDRGSFWNWGRFEFAMSEYGIPTVPVLFKGKYSESKVEELMSGTSSIASHIREGVVVKPFFERYDEKCGRVILKAVSPEYLEKSK